MPIVPEFCEIQQILAQIVAVLRQQLKKFNYIRNSIEREAAESANIGPVLRAEEKTSVRRVSTVVVPMVMDGGSRTKGEPPIEYSCTVLATR